MTQILICTVGGSHQPIVSAINDLRPDFVVFICTDRDPATNQPGSRVQIEGKGNCIKAHNGDANPTLPNIPTQTGLASEQYEMMLTLSDNLDRIYLDCITAIDNINRRFPDARIAADYTGGTKSMSAGLVMAVVESPDIDLQLVTGSRADLIKVQDGSQFSDKADCERVRYRRLTEPYRRAWQRYAYSEAVAGLAGLKPPGGLRDEYTRFRELSRAFAEWDNFNHAQALSILKTYAPSLPDHLKKYLSTANQLNDNNQTKQPPAKAGGFELRTESPDTRRLNDASYSGSILKLSFGFGSK